MGQALGGCFPHRQLGSIADILQTLACPLDSILL